MSVKNQFNPETPYYRSYLQFALAGKGRLNPNAVECVTEKFDTLVSVGRSPEFSFRVMMESYANESTDKACTTVKSVIEKSLDELNRTHRGIDLNPLTRLRKAIQTFNDNVDKCAVEIDGQEFNERDSVKLKLPSCFKQQHTFTATASNRSGKNLGLEVRF